MLIQGIVWYVQNVQTSKVHHKRWSRGGEKQNVENPSSGPAASKLTSGALVLIWSCERSASLIFFYLCLWFTHLVVLLGPDSCSISHPFIASPPDSASLSHTHTLIKEARGWGFSLCADVDRCEIPIVTSAHLSSAAVQLHNCVYTREKRSRVPAGDSSEAKEEVSECADVTFVLACVCALSLPLSNKHVWPTQKGT